MSSSESPPIAEPSWVDLGSFRPQTFQGRGRGWQFAWYLVSLAFFESGLMPASRVLVALLRLFGAKLGRGVVVKPNVRVKFPWKLTVGDHVWIGQGVWIDNIDHVVLGSHVCVSQEAYFCTGSHDYRSQSFDLVTKPIRVDDGAWITARVTLLGGAVVGANAIVTAGSVVSGEVPPGVIAGGVPAQTIKPRPRPVD